MNAFAPQAEFTNGGPERSMRHEQRLLTPAHTGPASIPTAPMITAKQLLLVTCLVGCPPSL